MKNGARNRIMVIGVIAMIAGLVATALVMILPRPTPEEALEIEFNNNLMESINLSHPKPEPISTMIDLAIVDIKPKKIIPDSVNPASTETCVPVNTAIPAVAIEQPEVWVTVFIHGIMSIKPHLSLNNIIRLMHDQVENTVYATCVEMMRNDPFFYKNQPMQAPGLHRISTENIMPGYASGILATLFNEVSQTAYATKNVSNLFYTYGWSGLLSPTMRYKDSVDLHRLLGAEVEQLKQQYGPNVKLRVIGYSHGGNVALGIALGKQKYPDIKYTIDELVLMGMPVQPETDFLVGDPMYKLVYHIYSLGDRIQQLDFLSTKRFFSSRVFKGRDGFTVPSNLRQIQLKVTKRTSPKRRCNRFDVTKDFDRIDILMGRSPLLRDRSPGHAEFWFFGWTPLHYRKKFPLYPLPMVSMLPVIFKGIDAYADKLNPHMPIIVDIRPDQELMIVRNFNDRCNYGISDFLSVNKLNELNEKIMRMAPHNYNSKTYNDHIAISHEKARIIHKELRGIGQVRPILECDR